VRGLSSTAFGLWPRRFGITLDFKLAATEKPANITRQSKAFVTTAQDGAGPIIIWATPPIAQAAAIMRAKLRSADIEKDFAKRITRQ
jgi:hypothetical protein